MIPVRAAVSFNRGFSLIRFQRNLLIELDAADIKKQIDQNKAANDPPGKATGVDRMDLF